MVLLVKEEWYNGSVCAGRPKSVTNREHAQITRKWEFVKFVQLVALVLKKHSP